MRAELTLDGTSTNADLDAALHAMSGPALLALRDCAARFERQHRAREDDFADFWRVVAIGAADVLTDRERVLSELERGIKPQGYRMPDENDETGEPIQFDFTTEGLFEDLGPEDLD